MKQLDIEKRRATYRQASLILRNAMTENEQVRRPAYASAGSVVLHAPWRPQKKRGRKRQRGPNALRSTALPSQEDAFDVFRDYTQGIELFCVCRTEEDDQVYIECNKKEDCVGYTWYHPACIGLVDVPNTEEEWYCPMCVDAFNNE